MTPERLRELLERVARGDARRPTTRSSRSSDLPFEDLGFAKVDHHRALRNGLPEVIFGAGKTAEQIVAIARAPARQRRRACSSRASTPTPRRPCVAALPELEYLRPARASRVWRGGADAAAGRGHDPRRRRRHRRPAGGRGGGADRRAAWATTSSASTTSASPASTACSPTASSCARASVLIVVAGMEGALPSVVGGLVDRPGHRRADQRRLRRQLRRPRRAAGDAQLLRRRRDGGQHRQRLRRRRRRDADQPAREGEAARQSMASPSGKEAADRPHPRAHPARAQGRRARDVGRLELPLAGAAAPVPLARTSASRRCSTRTSATRCASSSARRSSRAPS